MSRTLVMVTPADHGQQMSLEDFAEAQGQPGYLYELSRGVVQVMDIPRLSHGRVVDVLSDQLRGYRVSHPKRINYIGTGDSCKLLLPGFESERHPDIAIYLGPPPKLDPVWEFWVPDIVIEVVSPGQEKRDYEEKRDEYLAAGVKEYWVVDPASERFLVLRRKGDRWQELAHPLSGTYSPPLLPGLQLNLDDVQAAYRDASASS